MYTNSLDKIKDCNKCGLCFNQKPLLDSKQKADVFWVGLSAVKVLDTALTTPLADDSKTGKLISDIECLINNINFYKTNLVKCLPLNNDKIRYPSKDEMHACYSNLYSELSILSPKYVFLLGKQVADFVIKSQKATPIELDNDFNYKFYKKANITFIPVHHPSYVLIYKRKKIDSYINSFERILVASM